MRRLALFGGCLLLSTACAGGSARYGSGTHLGTGSRDVIQVAEYPEAQSLDVYQLVRRLRPFFLKSRGPSSIELQSGGLAVFLDDVPIGGVSELTSIPARDIRVIRFLGPSEAVIRHGRRFSGGILQLSTR
jgi:hypothetical protein